MEKSFQIFRIKSSYQGEDENGGINQIKVEDLVMATNYSEAEKLAYALYGDEKNFSYEIVKTKLSQVVYNSTFSVDERLILGLFTYYFEEDENTGVGIYAVTVVYSDFDEKGRLKKTKETIFLPAKSSSDAITATKSYLVKIGEQKQYIIRDVKFDQAESVLVTKETYERDVNE